VILALVVGTLLAVGALAFVLYPVFFGPPPQRRAASGEPRRSERDDAVTALREIEFDRATGKLSDVDYAELKRRYTQEAVIAMRREGLAVAASGAAPDDEIEAVIRAFRAGQASCRTCGPRPEPDADFCSNCGRYLHDGCASCGAPVEALDARYCMNCGTRLAA
jgi:hypothetical protein